MVASSATAALWCYCRVRVAAAAVALAFCGRCSTRCSVLSALSSLSVCLSVFSTISPVLPLRLDVGPLRHRLHLEPVRRLLWLLARLGAFPWRCACVARCQHGSTMRCATMSCVCSTRGTPRALNSHFLVAHLRSPLLLSRLLRSPLLSSSRASLALLCSSRTLLLSPSCA